MAQWYVKELSKLTQVSVRTLHHYEHIGLLKPSLRLSNGYRVYSEKDLLKLQQIVALKFFGFPLTEIKSLLAEERDMLGCFSDQSQLLEEKAKALLQASNAMKNILASCDKNKSIPWENIIQLIEVYRMTTELEKSWASKVFSPEQLIEYAGFQQSLSTEHNATQKQAFHEGWAAIVKEVANQIHKDPTSAVGLDIGERCWKLVHGLYGKKHAVLRNTIWEKGFKTGALDEPHGLTPEMVMWLDKAIGNYHRQRLLVALAMLETDFKRAEKLWDDTLEEMCGDSKPLQQKIYEAGLKEEGVSDFVKEWLRKRMQA